MGRGVKASDFFHKESKSRKKKKLGVGWRRRIDGWINERAQTHPFAPSTCLKLGAYGPFNFFEVGRIKMINVQVMSLTSSIYDHFII